MASVAAARAKIAELSQRAASERRRAARAAVIAADYEARIDLSSPSLRPLRIRLAALHRQLETRHVVAAQLQEFYASRLDRWACAGEATKGWPTFIDAVASAVGRRSASVTLLDRDGEESLVAVSDATARLAHDVEFVMGEGPAHDVAATFRLLRVGRFELLERWPQFGPVVADNGVGSLVSLPLRQEPGCCIGALCVFDPTPDGAADVVGVSGRVADALTHTVLNLPGEISNDDVPGSAAVRRDRIQCDGQPGRRHRGGHIGLRSDRRPRTAPRPCFRRRSADGDTGASRDRR